jgi:SAM-dependent methyltransferase
MSIEEALGRVSATFPFPSYIELPDAYVEIAAAVTRFVAPGSRILDVGAGACDKTAMLSVLGYRCTAVDDFQDPWHLADDNREKIETFAAAHGVEVSVGALPEGSFDAVMLINLLEHLHESPRELLVDLVSRLTAGGVLVVAVPNAVNIRKRVAVLRGHTNLPPFESFFWWPGPWRGHVREYTRGDLSLLVHYLGLTVLDLRSYHHMLTKVPARLRGPYRAITRAFPGWRDSWLLVARKPASWTPPTAPTKRPTAPRAQYSG